jgi:hypothetical protein
LAIAPDADNAGSNRYFADAVARAPIRFSPGGLTQDSLGKNRKTPGKSDNFYNCD